MRIFIPLLALPVLLVALVAGVALRGGAVQDQQTKLEDTSVVTENTPDKTTEEAGDPKPPPESIVTQPASQVPTPTSEPEKKKEATAPPAAEPAVPASPPVPVAPPLTDTKSAEVPAEQEKKESVAPTVVLNPPPEDEAPPQAPTLSISDDEDSYTTIIEPSSYGEGEYLILPNHTDEEVDVSEYIVIPSTESDEAWTDDYTILPHTHGGGAAVNVSEYSVEDPYQHFFRRNVQTHPRRCQPRGHRARTTLHVYGAVPPYVRTGRGIGPGPAW